MNQPLAPQQPSAAALIEQVVIGGDLAKLTPQQRVTYYRDVCDSLGLNPLTRPFQYITLNGKLVLYASRDCTDQLRSLRGVSVKLVETKSMEGVFLVRAQASDKMGRTDESTGAVSIGGLKGEALANALMKAETKAKRRVTLSICGLGMVDETEIETIRDARPEHVDMTTGEITPPRPAVRPAPKPMTKAETLAAGHDDLDELLRNQLRDDSAPSVSQPEKPAEPQAPPQAEGTGSPQPEAPETPDIARLLPYAQKIATNSGTDVLSAWWKKQPAGIRRALEPHKDALKEMAANADALQQQRYAEGMAEDSPA